MCRRTEIEEKISGNTKVEYLGFEIDGLPSPCHLWQGSHSGTGRGGGYPRMSLSGQTVAVHIVSYVNKNGYVPGKKQIDHLCNNRMCVNPDHLEMVTHKQNQKRRDLRRAAHDGNSNGTDSVEPSQRDDDSDHCIIHIGTRPSRLAHAGAELHPDS